jgi:hypothetical protein
MSIVQAAVGHLVNSMRSGTASVVDQLAEYATQSWFWFAVAGVVAVLAWRVVRSAK